MTTLRFSECGRYALVERDEQVYVHPVRGGEVNANGGRWECSATHLDTFAGVYAARFPVSA